MSSESALERVTGKDGWAVLSSGSEANQLYFYSGALHDVRPKSVIACMGQPIKATKQSTDS